MINNWKKDIIERKKVYNFLGFSNIKYDLEDEKFYFLLAKFQSSDVYIRSNIKTKETHWRYLGLQDINAMEWFRINYPSDEELSEIFAIEEIAATTTFSTNSKKETLVSTNRKESHLTKETETYNNKSIEIIEKVVPSQTTDFVSTFTPIEETTNVSLEQYDNSLNQSTENHSEVSQNVFNESNMIWFDSYEETLIKGHTNGIQPSENNQIELTL